MKRRLFPWLLTQGRAWLAPLYLFLFVALRLPTAGADFSVVTTNDSGPGSLREALLAANQSPGSDRILFDVPGDGLKVIRVTSQLPMIDDSVEINGFSQPGSRPNSALTVDDAVRMVELDGVTQQFDGLVIRAGESTIRGLRMRRFAAAIAIQSSSNVVAGCFLGYEQPIPGSVDILLGNLIGIRVGGVCCMELDICCNRIGGETLGERNVIAGNGGSPIRLGEVGAVTVRDTSILGNFVGVDSNGKTHSLAYGWSAITVRTASGVWIGSATDSGRNILAVARPGFPGRSDYASAGINIYSTSTRISIRGNYIGVAADGTTPLLAPIQQDIGVLIQTPYEGAIAFKDCLIEGNIMANMCEGVWVQELVTNDGSVRAANGVTLRSNLISSVVFSPVVLGRFLQTNDLGDVDAGANDRQNYPEISEVVATNGATLINGILHSAPLSTYDLEFFASASVATNDIAMPERFVERVAVVTDSDGVAAFSVNVAAWTGSNRYYSATATDAGGNTSMISPATHVRTLAPFVFEHPTNRTVLPGANAAFAAAATGMSPLNIQWRHDGKPIPGATSLSLSLTNVRPELAGLYDLVLGNEFGVTTSRTAKLVVAIRPLIVQQPLSQSVASNRSVTLSVGVTNTASLPLLFVWRSNNLTVATEFSDRRVSFFKTPPLQRDASYVVVVSNALTAAVLSSRANLTVLLDSDGDGLPDAYESVHGLNPTDATDALSDPDGDGLNNADEFVAGTDPHDSSNQLRVHRIAGDTGGALIEFHASSNKTYLVQYRDAVALEGWQPLLRVAARETNRLESVVDSVPSATRYYRLVTPGF
jgi:hypothetical protein